jgi:hypothetical protein
MFLDHDWFWEGFGVQGKTQGLGRCRELECDPMDDYLLEAGAPLEELLEAPLEEPLVCAPLEEHVEELVAPLDGPTGNWEEAPLEELPVVAPLEERREECLP